MNLIHMNGRIYDPVLGRFMTPDFIVQAPQNLQSYNRYSYVINNPLMYTDPTGYLKISFGPVHISIGGSLGDIVGKFVRKVIGNFVGAAVSDLLVSIGVPPFIADYAGNIVNRSFQGESPNTSVISGATDTLSGDHGDFCEDKCNRLSRQSTLVSASETYQAGRLMERQYYEANDVNTLILTEGTSRQEFEYLFSGAPSSDNPITPQTTNIAESIQLAQAWFYQGGVTPEIAAQVEKGYQAYDSALAEREFQRSGAIEPFHWEQYLPVGRPASVMLEASRPLVRWCAICVGTLGLQPNLERVIVSRPPVPFFRNAQELDKLREASEASQRAKSVIFQKGD